MIESRCILQPFHCFTYITAHSPTLPLLHLRHSSFSNPTVASPTSQLILQPFFRFSYVTGSSLTSPGEPSMICNRTRALWNNIYSNHCAEKFNNHFVCVVIFLRRSKFYPNTCAHMIVQEFFYECSEARLINWLNHFFPWDWDHAKIIQGNKIKIMVTNNVNAIS